MVKTMNFSVAIVATVATTVVFWLLNRRRMLRMFKDLGIPGPEPDFIWGNMKQSEHRRIEAAMEWRKKYGKKFGIYVGSEPFLVIADPQMAHECVVKQADIFQDRPVVFVDWEPFKSSILQLGGKAWKYVRTRLNYGFSSGLIKDLSRRANLCAARFAERISSISLTNGYVEVFHCGLDYTFDFFMNTMLAEQVRSEEDSKETIMESLERVIKDTVYTAIQVAFPIPVVRELLTTIYPLTKHSRAFRNVTRHIQKSVELHRSGELPKEPCVLRTVLEAQTETLNAAHTKSNRQGKYLDDPFLSSNIAIFLWAGLETTTSLLSFLMYLLARHPKEQEEVFKEIDEVLSSDKCSDSSNDKLHLLKRVDMVINEGLRLYPPIPLFVVRRCTRDTTVCGQFIPAGLNIMVPPWLIHRDSDYWPEPDEFRPDRFAEENIKSHHKGAYIPFGLGSRVCIGRRLAFMATKYALVRVLQNYRLSLRKEATASPILSVPCLTLAPGDGVTVRLERRQANMEV